MSMQPQLIPSKSEHGYVAPDYLEATSQIVAPIKAQSYAQTRLQAGHRVLDVRCGVSNGVMALAQLVGSGGQNLGADANLEMVQQSRSKLRA